MGSGQRWYRFLALFRSWAIPLGVFCAAVAVGIHFIFKWQSTDAMYEAGQLLVLNLDSDKHGPSTPLWIARLFATTALLFLGIEVVLQVGGRGIDRFRLLYRKHVAPHFHEDGKRVLVIGSGEGAAAFACSLVALDWRTGQHTNPRKREGLRNRVVTHLSVGTQRVTGFPSESGPVLSITRPILTPLCLREIGVANYTDVVIIEPDDSKSLETLATLQAAAAELHMSGPTRARPTTRICIRSPEVGATLRRATWAAKPSGGPVRIWCPDDLSARRALQTVDLDEVCSFAEPGGHSTVVLIGFGEANRVLAARAISQIHHVDETRLQIHVFDHQAAHCWSLFQQAWPGVAQAVDHTLHEVDAHGPGVFDWLREQVREQSTNLLIAVSVGDVDANLALATAILDALEAEADNPKAVMMIRQSGVADSTAIASFVCADSASSIQVRVWGDAHSSQASDDVLEEEVDRLAMAVHAEYLKGEQAREPDTWQMRLQDATKDPYSSLKDWSELSRFLRDDNRNCVEFAHRRLSALGLRLVDEVQPGQSEIKAQDLSEDELTTLARLEHRRWMVNRLMNGWKLGGKKDWERRTHPDLVPWEKLPRQAQLKDRRVMLEYEGERIKQMMGSGTRLVRFVAGID
jgi:hypothetical protein